MFGKKKKFVIDVELTTCDKAGWNPDYTFKAYVGQDITLVTYKQGGKIFNEPLPGIWSKEMVQDLYDGN